MSRAPEVLNGLDPFSRSFAEELIRAFPEFESRTNIDQGVLTLEVAPGIPRPSCKLYVSTADGEITVGLGGFHTHFAWPVLHPGNEWEDPIAFIRALMNGTTLIVDRLRNGEWTSSTTLTAEEALGPIELEPGETAQVWSWTGAGDRTITAGR